VVAAPGSRPNRPPMTATKEGLIQRIHRASDPIQSFLMKVKMASSVGSQYQGTITDYATVGAYILYQRPDALRIIGQDPLLSTTIFDMVSTGREFRIDIPSKKRFLVGDNEAPANSKNELENIRPVAFLTALLITPPDPEQDLTLLEDGTSGKTPIFTLLIIRRENDQYRILRNVSFDAFTLQIVGQKTFDSSGYLTSVTTYSNWKAYGPMAFPSDIDIERPRQDYEVHLEVGSMKINPPDVTSEKFVLEQPAGTKLEQLK
jgi:outer membrane lipoprotein-sorting protein